jgi:predicted butyrate kinase (DUF1464 family)
MLSLGIDYGAATWNAALWDEARAADLHTFSRAADVWEFLEETRRNYPGLPVVLPSGFGVPLTRAGDLLDRDIAEMTLAVDTREPDGLAAFLDEARRRLPRAFCVPAVKLLSSVPPHRKIRRLDLGSAGALCATAWVLHCLREAGRPLADCSLLHLHLDPNGRALLALARGHITDGIGATTIGLGIPPADFQRDLLTRFATSRVRTLAGSAPTAAHPSAAREALQKETHALLAFHGFTEIVVTGAARQNVSQALGDGLHYTILPAPGAGYEPALGAAVIAAGLTGGPTAGLVEHLGLRETRKRLLDGLVP